MVCIFVSVILIIVGIIFKLFPPKKINSIYGYRTTFSMSRQDIWDYAQGLGALSFIYSGILIGIIGLTLVIFNLDNETIEMFIFIPVMIVTLILDEIRLKKRFKRENN